LPVSWFADANPQKKEPANKCGSFFYDWRPLFRSCMILILWQLKRVGMFYSEKPEMLHFLFRKPETV
jgi:hypothetical protein